MNVLQDATAAAKEEVKDLAPLVIFWAGSALIAAVVLGLLYAIDQVVSAIS